MALASTVKYNTVMVEPDPKNSPLYVRDMSIVSDWLEVLLAGGVDGADNSGNQIVNPTATITAATARLTQIDRGTLAIFRMKYDDGVSGVTDPVLNIFGRVAVSTNGSQGPWMPLKTREDTPSLNMTLTTDLTNDMTDGTYKFTNPDYKANVIDLCGCNEILVGVKTAFAATGTVTTATVEMKVI